ncbi:uncharacterized protein LOC115471750 [Microcaecilia unicolor]|uniref:Uncharacterized protein LOC115471750 n=1 Tax=Microcaecilia unicolor TaxID=1415580 RepID=A0A6P7Y8U0_9AMPH|nr:uncharacterized protein LOC115471750 [Microcaecilia unicolor]
MAVAEVAVDSGINLPWSGFPAAHFCFNPPGAFYFGQPWLRYDCPVFLEDMDLNSYQQFPAWLDGFKMFQHRIYKQHLTVIFQLYEVTMDVHPADTDAGQDKSSKKATERAEASGGMLGYNLGHKAWTALHVFTNTYCNTGVYQLPLYHGAPSQTVLADLCDGECIGVLGDLLRRKVIQLVTGASLIVRIADGRRSEELKDYTKQDIDLSYLPTDAIDGYNYRQPTGPKISELIPQQQSGNTMKWITGWLKKVLNEALHPTANSASHLMNMEKE